MGEPRGYLSLVLHAHLPYIRHPEHPDFLEERWLFEAITECYLPLLDCLERLAEEGVPYRLTLSLSPTLAAMLTDPILKSRYRRHLERLLDLAQGEIGRLQSSAREGAELARYYLHLLQQRRRQYDTLYQGDLIAGFRRLADRGHLELMASAATHAYLPLLWPHREAVLAQVRLGLEDYRARFQREPAGFWLPECGYEPAFAPLLAREGIRYVLCDTHAILHARPRPRYGVYAPVRCRESGLAVLGRDPEASEQVWSARHGYPSDPWYRDFYRDIGFELAPAHLPPWLRGGLRSFTGLKYYRVGTAGQGKGLYVPEQAHRRVREHAAHFVAARLRTADALRDAMERPPLMVAPYDAELFGHWWFEGPLWLEEVLRLLAQPASPVRLTTPGQYLARYGPPQRVRLALSSWGEGGYSQVWLARHNRWVYPRLEEAAARCKALVRRFTGSLGWEGRALSQACRELLLAQSSDWTFIMKTGTVAEYAHRRIGEHLERFHRLADGLTHGRLDPGQLAQWEWQNPIFPHLDPQRLFTAPGA